MFRVQGRIKKSLKVHNIFFPKIIIFTFDKYCHVTHVITSVFSRAFQIYKQNKKLLAISDFFETPIRRLTVLYPTLNGEICSQL